MGFENPLDLIHSFQRKPRKFFAGVQGVSFVMVFEPGNMRCPGASN